MTENADNAQNFFYADAAAQVEILPQLSKEISEDNFTAAQWLVKVINHKEGADWTDAQTITHIRSLLDWYNSLKPLHVNITNWNQIKERFRIDFQAAPPV